MRSPRPRDSERCRRRAASVWESSKRRCADTGKLYIASPSRDSHADGDGNSPEELSISYNGGKDCLVLLILYLSALHSYHARPVDGLHTSNKTNNHHQHHPPPARLPTRLNSVYIVTQHPFQAVEDFVASSVEYYHLSMTRYAKPMKEGFADYLREHPKIRAIFVGTRRTDPHGGELVHFDPTDRGWPDFMRIHPVIDWHYAEIWAFIRELGITYCELYDMGYTSLGGTTDTQPNPALGVGSGGFRPAYELLQDEEERLGRNR